jgi:hypothetical protein
LICPVFLSQILLDMEDSSLKRAYKGVFVIGKGDADSRDM